MRLVALAGLLLASLALNIWLWRSHALAATVENAATATASAGEVATCRTALARCQAANPGEPTPTGTTAAPPAFELPRALFIQPDAGAGAPFAARPVVSDLTPELQQDMLSQVAREKLRDEWKKQERSILAGLRTSLADPAKQHDDAQREGHKLATEAGFDDATTERFLADYEQRRMACVATLRDALAADPPDWATALAEVRALYAYEDALARTLGGDDACKRLRTAQAEGRTVILAIGASLANQPWEQAVRW
jgi:hypothetical protein